MIMGGGGGRGRDDVGMGEWRMGKRGGKKGDDCEVVGGKSTIPCRVDLKDQSL